MTNSISRLRFWIWLIRMIGVIVPRRLRTGWRQEWEAELSHREELLERWDQLNLRTRIDLIWRSASAFWDALWMQSYRWEDEVIQDLRFGFRMMLKKPAFATVAVITLALGIGANTAIFSMVNAVLLRPLPFRDPSRVVSIWESNRTTGATHGSVSGANFTDWTTQNEAFQSIAAYFSWNYNFTGRDEPQRLTATLVSGEFFSVVGVDAALGRVLLPDDDREDRENVVVLSNPFWRSRFGADPAVIGQTITLNNLSHTIVGVLPARFAFPDEKTEIWRPMAMSPQNAQNREGKWLKVIGRLNSHVNVDQASVAMNTLADQLAQSYPATNTGSGVYVEPLHAGMVAKSRGLILTLFGAVLAVLLLACVNLANLLIARAASRQKENAVRAALGAKPFRLIRQFLIENLILAAIGAALGLPLAYWIINALIAFGPDDLPGLNKTSIDGTVLGFTLILALLTTLLFALIPGWQGSRPDLSKMLKEGGQFVSGNASRRLHGALVVIEVAGGVILLVVAGLMVRSFARLTAVEPGFDPRNVLTMRVMLPAARYRDSQHSIDFFHRAVDRISNVSGVMAVGAVQDLPLGQNAMKFPFTIEGRAAQPTSDRAQAGYRAVTDDYFHTMGISVLEGREFSASDNLQSEPVVVINQSMARRFWPDEDPINKRIRFGDEGDCTQPNTTSAQVGRADGCSGYRIVGVVGDVKHMGLEADEVPSIYQPHSQMRFSWLRWMTIVVRTESAPMSLVSAVRGRILEVDPTQPIYDVATMEQLLSKSVAKQRFSALLFGSFGLLALLLAAVGLYGVMSYAVAERAHEIGLRIALGAQVRSVLLLVIGFGMKLTLLGLLIGIAGAFAVTNVLRTMLFNVSATDPLAFVGAPTMLLLVALLASFIPARRAATIDPLIALRNS